MSDVSTYPTTGTMTEPQRRGNSLPRKKAAKKVKQVVKEPVFPADAEDLFKDYWPRALGLAILFRVPDSQQVANDALADAMRNYNPAIGSFGGRLYIMVRRRAVRALRMAAQREKHEVELTLDEDEIAARKVDAILELELARTVEAALSTLRSTDREIIRGKFLLGKTYREIAAELKRPSATVRNRIRPIFKKLRWRLRALRPSAS